MTVDKRPHGEQDDHPDSRHDTAHDTAHDNSDRPHGIKRALRILGPGLITGASDDDPSGIATYAQAGATYGNGLLWTVPLTLPLMIAVQEICDRTALATGKSLGALARERFTGKLRGVIWVLLIALFLANLLNIAADLLAIGEGMELLGTGPAHLWSAVAGVAIAIALFFGSFKRIASLFKWLCISLFAYVFVLAVANVEWANVLTGLVGLQFRWSSAYLGLIVAILGTTISPYLFFWQSANRIEEMRDEKVGGNKPEPLSDRSDTAAHRKVVDTRTDVITGMAFSVLVMFAIIAATAATLGENGTEVGSAADAAKALEPVAGPAASVLFALGFIGSGILAVPVLVGAGSAGIAGLTNSKWGLERSPRKAPLFYLLIGVGTIGGVLLSFFTNDPIGLLVFSALINGIAAAPFLVVIMIISGDRRLMGAHRNGKLAATLGWGTTGIMLVAGVIGVWQTFAGG